LMIDFCSSFFVLNHAASGFVANPITDPIAFGLTYWSLYLLNRLINLPINAGFVSFAAVASVVLVAVALVIVYWRIGKMTFQKPNYDLAFILLFPVLALFLSNRIICEQFFVWAIPFLVILCVGGRVKGALYWAASIIALLYAVLNCPLPFFFLPLAPWYANILIGTVHAFWAIEPVRIMLLAILGCMFSILLVFILVQLSKMQGSKNSIN
jgi:hypothetical protein